MIITNLLFILCPIIGYGYSYEAPIHIRRRPQEGFVDDPNLPLFINGRAQGGFLRAPYVDDSNVQAPPAQWFTQNLNHFDDSEMRTWNQRYFVSRTYFTAPDGPVFCFIGGEGALSPYWLASGSMVDYAKANGAMLIALEHRFYGESHPLSDASTANLKYLTSEQALGDLANFQQAMISQYKLSSKNKWIMFGGSYPGALSAWYRYKYPHLAHGAVASSAPIRAKVDFPEYLEVCSAALAARGTAACEANVGKASALVDEYLQTIAGRTKLSYMFKTCNKLTEDKDQLYLFAQSLAGNFMQVIQYNKPNEAFEGAENGVNIRYLCNIMNNEQYGDPLHRYAAVNEMLLKHYRRRCLYVDYKSYIQYMKESNWGAGSTKGAMRQWIYQTCTEFGYYQTTDSKKQAFGNSIPLSMYTKSCTDIYGDIYNTTTINRGARWSNTNYGAYDLAKGASRIVFPNGSIDPWHALSFLKSEEDILAIYINGTSHCANMYAASPNDPKELRDAKQKIGNIVKGWLAVE